MLQDNEIFSSDENNGQDNVRSTRSHNDKVNHAISLSTEFFVVFLGFLVFSF